MKRKVPDTGILWHYSSLEEHVPVLGEIWKRRDWTYALQGHYWDVDNDFTKVIVKRTGQTKEMDPAIPGEHVSPHWIEILGGTGKIFRITIRQFLGAFEKVDGTTSAEPNTPKQGQ